MSWWLPLFGAALFWVLARYFLRVRQEARRAPEWRIDPDDPLLPQAFERARAARAEFEALFYQRPRDTFVRIAASDAQAAERFVWVRLVELGEDEMKVCEPVPPMAAGAEEPAPYAVPRAALEDWQVELPDGNIRGGFTLEVQFLRAAQAWNGLPPWMAEQHVRYVDHVWSREEAAQKPEGA